ncbi:MAG: SLBB domain-containing protein [Burkholderiales bacterium]
MSAIGAAVLLAYSHSVLAQQPGILTVPGATQNQPPSERGPTTGPSGQTDSQFRTTAPTTPTIRSKTMPGVDGVDTKDKKFGERFPRDGEFDFNLPEQNEFQQFVKESLGKELPLYGYDLFRGAPSTFAPVEDIPVTPDYIVGPGDELEVRAWGQIDVDYRATVDRTGFVYIPKIGNIKVGGLKYQELPEYLKTVVGRTYRGFDLSVNLGRLRSVQVFVVGQARRPGNYTVSSLSTLVNALFASGGPTGKGSMRRIQLKRGNQIVTEFDLYDLLIKGDKSRDAPLKQGDVIYIPPVGPLVAVGGSVNVPAIFELKNQASLGEVIEYAGGLATTASGKKTTIERIEDRRVRKVDEFTLDQQGYARLLKDGDLVNIFPLSPRIENAVTLRGNVSQPMRFAWREGLRVRDLVPEKEALIRPDYWQAKNQTIRPQLVKDPKSTESMNLDKNIPDKNSDKKNSEPKTSDTKLLDAVKRNANEINWDYAVVERFNEADLSSTLLPFNLGNAILGGKAEDDLVLKVGDVITIFSKDDIRVPQERQSKYVRLEGEFQQAGVYKVENGETLRKLIARVGGFSQNQYLFGAEFSRESTRLLQQKRMEEAIERLEKEIERNAATQSRASLSAEDIAGVKQQQETQRVLVNKLKQAKALGRIVLEITPNAASAEDLPDLALEDGDRLFIPSRPSTVSVFGAVYNENTFIHKQEKQVMDYLQQAGGVTKDGDDKSIYIIRADGSVLSKGQTGWFGGFGSLALSPGDAIVVPEEFDKTSYTKIFKDWTQIFYQFGLGVAGLKVLRGL